MTKLQKRPRYDITIQSFYQKEKLDKKCNDGTHKFETFTFQAAHYFWSCWRSKDGGQKWIKVSEPANKTYFVNLKKMDCPLSRNPFKADFNSEEKHLFLVIQPNEGLGGL